MKESKNTKELRSEYKTKEDLVMSCSAGMMDDRREAE